MGLCCGPFKCGVEERLSQEMSDLEGKLHLNKPGDLELESTGNFSGSSTKWEPNPGLQGCSEEYVSMSCGSALSAGKLCASVRCGYHETITNLDSLGTCTKRLVWAAWPVRLEEGGMER